MSHNSQYYARLSLTLKLLKQVPLYRTCILLSLNKAIVTQMNVGKTNLFYSRTNMKFSRELVGSDLCKQFISKSVNRLVVQALWQALIQAIRVLSSSRDNRSEGSSSAFAHRTHDSFAHRWTAIGCEQCKINLRGSLCPAVSFFNEHQLHYCIDAACLQPLFR